MIPLIIGGVAFAATGYGLAKILEDDCIYSKDTDSDNEHYEPVEDESIEKFELVKKELFDTSFMELKTALKEIDNLDEEVLIVIQQFKKAKYPFEELTNDIKESFEKYTQILQDVKTYIENKLDTLDSIIIDEHNYEKYSDDNKKLVAKLIKICNLVDKATISQMTINNVDISREVKRGFLNIETIIN